MLLSSAYELHYDLMLLDTLIDEVKSSANEFAASIKYWVL